MAEEYTPREEYIAKLNGLARKAFLVAAAVGAVALGYTVYETRSITNPPEVVRRYNENKNDITKLTEIKERLKTNSIDEAVSNMQHESSQIESNPEMIKYQTIRENQTRDGLLTLGALVLALSGIASIGIRAGKKLKRQYQGANQ